jgi:hypothetical protein
MFADRVTGVVVRPAVWKLAFLRVVAPALEVRRREFPDDCRLICEVVPEGWLDLRVRDCEV